MYGIFVYSQAYIRAHSVTYKSFELDNVSEKGRCHVCQSLHQKRHVLVVQHVGAFVLDNA